MRERALEHASGRVPPDGAAGPGLTDGIKQAIRTALANVTATLPGFRSRPAQRLMIAEIAKTLAGEHGGAPIIAVEGPTGTGKSLAYLLAAIPLAKALRKQLVISTATVALQEQIVERDLPALAETARLDFSFGLAKGRRRYVCNRTLALLAGKSPEQSALDLGAGHEDVAGWTRPPRPGELQTIESMQRSLDAESWTGDLDAWGDALSADLVELITTGNHGCLGTHCAAYQRCAYFRARWGLKKLDVIVANHDLVLADAAMGGGAILPPPEESIFIFDEGHHLAAKAVEHFGAQAALRGAAQWLHKAPRSAETLRAVLPEECGGTLDRLQALAPELADALLQVNATLEAGFPREPPAVARPGRRRPAPEAVWRFPQGSVPPGLDTAAADIAATARELLAVLVKLRGAFARAVEAEKIARGAVEKTAAEIGFLLGRTENLAGLWRLMAETAPDGAPPTARWITRTAGPEGDYLVAASPVSAAALLRRALWERCAGAVITSATLTALRRFDRLRLALGLRDDDGTQYLTLPSPFDYARKAVLCIPHMAADPGEPDAHTEEIIRVLPERLDPAEATLVLFASARQMDEVAARLPAALRAITLVQNELPKHEILRRHRAAVEEGSGSVIFGLASFAEGVDLPGRLCTHVVIAKLPFAVPDSPVEATYAEWLESQGRNPFLEVSVPDASLRLIQACGRLIRSETDSGRVTLLDRRAVTRRYGRQILDSLPPFRREIG
jgi:ATP-dependent DNA helicase DinG